ncbi:amidase [Gilliamella sp. ESL0443]|uniref:amidase n=1 Tax=Gilliamella sp. ESL0443 TaxID=2704655 RepID=UPI001C698EDF|nr:amidase [Gilliamella sp. ESL0443]QYN42505.1 amidase [Gilliamella sp. ESL0443]
MLNECLNMSALKLSNLIKTKQLSVYEVVSAHIERSQYCNPYINAIVCKHFEEALLYAKKLDQCRKIDEQQIFYGVPFTVKESIAVKDKRNTSGSLYRKNHIANSHATSVDRLLNAGAIIIGQTNLSELALWPECNNLIYGRTNNPHNLHHTSGGSSGGDAAIVACGGVPFGLGTDGGGSIRIPAACCGVFGHKSSSKYIPMTGHLPLDNYWINYKKSQFIARFFSIGPICRKAEDIFPILSIISGPDGKDKNITNKFSYFRKLSSFDEIKIYCIDFNIHPLLKKANKEVKTALRTSVKLLESAGATTIYLGNNILYQACELWFEIFQITEELNIHYLVNENRSLLSELFKLTLGKKQLMFSTIIMLIMEKFPKKKKMIIDFLYKKNKISSQINKYLSPQNVLLLPTLPTSSVKHHQTYFSPFNFLYCGLFNVLELPATSIPISWSKTYNLPISIQAICAHGKDHISISVACFLEKMLGGWKLPNLVKNIHNTTLG